MIVTKAEHRDHQVPARCVVALFALRSPRTPARDFRSGRLAGATHQVVVGVNSLLQRVSRRLRHLFRNSTRKPRHSVRATPRDRRAIEFRACRSDTNRARTVLHDINPWWNLPARVGRSFRQVNDVGQSDPALLTNRRREPAGWPSARRLRPRRRAIGSLVTQQVATSHPRTQHRHGRLADPPVDAIWNHYAGTRDGLSGAAGRPANGRWRRRRVAVRRTAPARSDRAGVVDRS